MLESRLASGPVPPRQNGPMLQLNTQVIDGHRWILSAIERFAPALDSLASEAPDEAGLLAADAFFRQKLVPLADWEETVLARTGTAGDALTFEHSFIAAEVERFGEELNALREARAHGDLPRARAAARALARRRDRLEAAIELHVTKEEQLHGAAAGVPDLPLDLLPPSADGQRVDGAVHALSEAGCRAVLARVGWATLSTSEEGHPYAVPVTYGIAHEDLYVAMRAGRKYHALEHNPEVCLTVVEVDRLDSWASVVVTGRVVWIEGLRARLEALQAMRRQHRIAGHLTMADVGRLLRAHVARIEVRGLSGRARGK